MKDDVKYHKKGFCVSSIGNDKYEIQRIDDPKNWGGDGSVPPLLKSDDVAKKLAIEEGFVFSDKNNPYLITGKKIWE